MITIYTVSSCTSCKKAKTWLNAHQLTYKEQNLGKEGITKEELMSMPKGEKIYSILRKFKLMK